MSLCHSIQQGTQDVREVKGLRFGILSPDTILRESVAHIFKHIGTKDTQHTLMDPRLGATRTAQNAITGLNTKYDPGNFGHCVLALPVYHPNFFEYVKNIMKAICHNCSSLRIQKEDYNIDAHMRRSPDKRLPALLKLKLTKCAYCESMLYDVQKDPKTEILGLVMINKKESAEPIVITPKQVHDIFKKITDEDAAILGFDPVTSRPEWMVITILPIAPPTVRPSVQGDNDKTSDDDITQAYYNIIKHNNLLQEAIERAEKGERDDDLIKREWRALQWYVATLIDNETNAYPQVTNRAHRPLKTIKSRHKGKYGRLRMNLMGKRTNHSSRSVITADPNLSMCEIGVPREIAMTLTFPQVVTRRNIQYLTTLVRRGPKQYPGANEIKKPGQSYPINLGCISDEERRAMKLTVGTIVYRHMVNGDIVIFNRQPSLHKSSMMGHYAVVLPGRSLRMQVNVTGPYNADFDGDEMNMHFLQSEMARREWEALALTRTQIVSPQANQPIISAVQDTLLAAYRSSSEQTRGYGPDERDYLTPRDFMHLANWIQKYRGRLPPLSSKAPGATGWTMRQLYNMYLPPISLRRTGGGKGSINIINGIIDDPATGPCVPISKANGLLSTSGGSLMHVAWNDLGALAAQDLIDDFSRIMSQWFIINGFSVGMRDIQLRKVTKLEVEGIKRRYLAQASVLIDGLNSGNYERARKKILKDAPRGLVETEYAQFESDIYYVLGRCRSEIEELTVKNISLTEEGKPYDNRFMSMVNSGSKGNKVNLVQIVSMIGQQDMAGARVQDSYRRRPMPFLSKDDFSPAARGFISNSYMAGLSFLEYIYHAMAGRLGVISTSIKTAETGYLQRKLMKRLEDFRTMYDMTVRSNSGMILQYVYGGDSYNGSKIEPQRIDYLAGNMEDLIIAYGYNQADWESLNEADQLEAEMTAASAELETLKKDWRYLRGLYKYDLPKSYPCIVNFDRLIKSVKSRLRSAGGQAAALPEERLKPSIVLAGLQALEQELVSVLPTTETISVYTLRMFFCIMRSKLASKILILKEDYNRMAFLELLDEVRRKFYKGLVPPGEAVGAIAAQSIGEPSTQMTLDAFHSTGSKATVSGGVPRFKEILSLTKMKTPSATIYLKGVKIPEVIMAKTGGASSIDAYLQGLPKDEQKSTKEGLKVDYIMHAVLPIKSTFEYLRFSDIVSRTELLYIESLEEEDIESVRDLELLQVNKGNMSKWYLKYYLNPEHRDTIMQIDGGLAGLCQKLGVKAYFLPGDINAEEPWIMANFKLDSIDPETLMSDIMSEELAILHTRIRGVTDITKATVREPVKKDIHLPDGRIITVGSDDYAEASNSVMDAEDYIIDTVGTNLVEILSMPNVDPYRTYSNSVQEMYEMYGIEGARRAIIRETQEVFNNAGVSFDIRHIELLADAMTCRGSLQKIDRSGAKKGDTGPIAVASFEETTTAMCKAAAYGEVDNLKGVSANIVHGQMVKVGTGAFDVYLDEAMILANTLAEMEEEEDVGPMALDQSELEGCHPEMVQFGFAL